MSFVQSYDMYERICQIEDREPSQEEFEQLMELTKAVQETPLQDQYQLDNIQKAWDAYIQEHPESTVDEFLNTKAS